MLESQLRKIGEELKRRETRQSGFEILKNPDFRETLKDRLIRLVDYIEDQNIETVVFLDKSARPLAWLLTEYMRNLSGDHPRPEIKFINVGKVTEETARKYERNEDVGTVESLFLDYEYDIRDKRSDEYYDAPKPSTDKERKEQYDFMHLKKDRSKLKREQKTVDNNLDALDTLASAVADTFPAKDFSGKNVLIIDEYQGVGASQEVTMDVLDQAFPNINQLESIPLFDRFEPGYTNETIPWMRQEGMSGVIEESDEALLAKKFTKADAEKIREKAFSKWKRIDLKNVLFTFQDCERQINDLIEKLTATIDEYSHDEEYVKFADEAIKKLHEIGELDLDKFADLSTIEQAKQWNVFYSLLTEEEEAVKQMSVRAWQVKLYGNLMGFEYRGDKFIPYYGRYSADEANKAAKLIARADDIKKFVNETKQLRAEMKKLAKEAVQTKTEA
ncbi:MAG: hypothetical protein ABH846_01025 [Patescibacteria group bacterium]